MDWSANREQISDIFNYLISRISEVFQVLSTSTKPLNSVFPIEQVSMIHNMEFSSNQAFPLRAVFRSVIENSEVLGTVDFRWKDPRTLRLKELMYLSDVEIAEKTAEFVTGSPYLNLEVSADICLESGSIIVSLAPVLIPWSNIEADNRTKIIAAIQAVKTWFIDNSHHFITRTPAKDGDFWACANCYQCGFKGKIEWHGPGSSICPIING